MAEEESGMDELLRLSQQFKKQDEENTARERLREKHGKKTQDVLQGLKDIKITMTVDQLKSFAAPEIIEEVNSLRNKRGTEDLRKTISRLADEMENKLDNISATNPEMAPIADMVKTLNILLDLYFSL